MYDDFQRPGPVRPGRDVRLIVENSANSTPYGNKILGGLVGLRLDGSGTPLVPVTPYVQAEIGGVGTSSGTSTSRTTSFTYQVQFGGDFTIVPHVQARLEYGAGQLTSINTSKHTLQTFGIGLVVRLF